jgi:hypothetical protein
MCNEGWRSIVRDNGLTIVLSLMFFVSLVGMVGTGLSAFNEERIAHGLEGLSLVSYLTNGAFVSALFENWESEFLQMASYVMLTAVLVQRGSAESKDPDDKAEESAPDSHSPWPVKRGGWLGWLYGRSLGLSLLVLFIVSFCLHWWGSLRAANADAILHGKSTTSGLDYLFGAQFWFESFQNWQSEFLSTAVLVVLSIFLRQKGSPESKPVNASHRQTGA